MEKYINKYIDFILKVKGVSRKYAEVTDFNLSKLGKFLKEINIDDIGFISRHHMCEFQEDIMKKDLAPSTKHSILMTAQLFFKYLHEYEHLQDNPSLVIDLPKRGRQILRNIMNEEEVKFLLTLPDHKELLGIRDLCIMNLLYSSAMRPKEVFNLQLGDIDLKRCQALVRRPKNKRDRIVHFDRYTANFIRQYIKQARSWLLKNKKSNHIFLSATGSNLRSASWAGYFTNKYKPIMVKRFKKNITPYSFRHTSATHWLDSGARHKKDILPYIQRQLGHESLESTTIYTQVAIEPLREMFRRYHPRELSQKSLNKIPSPSDVISRLKDKSPPSHK